MERPGALKNNLTKARGTRQAEKKKKKKMMKKMK
jgi:hypothetical protein